MQAGNQGRLSPIVKWVGGKRGLLSEILPLIPGDINLYVEPFVGGGAVLLALAPQRALVNDSNPELINVYQVVQTQVDELVEQLRVHAANNSADYFYKVRALDRDPAYKAAGRVARAARFIYLNKTCFNGLYRVNRAGQVNSPYGAYKNPNIVNENGLQALADYLNTTDIEFRCGDYAATLTGLPAGAFVYLDPPYMPISTTSNFTGYTASGFTYSEQVRLRDSVAGLREQEVRFLLSNSDCDAVRDLYKDFQIKTVQARRNVNAKASGRGQINEVLIYG